MFPGFPTLSLKLADLFADPYHFTIPGYQRSYSWTIKEAGQLVDDLMTAAGVDGDESGEPDYFLSSIVLLAPEDAFDAHVKATSGVYDIVDGQQRLITLLLLASILRASFDSGDLTARLDQLAGPSRWGPVRIELRGRERACFEWLLAGSADTDDREPDDAVSVGEHNLIAVRDRFAAVVSQLDVSERQRLAGYICDHCHVVVIYTHEVDRAHRMFTVLNERGRPLQRNDILKAEVLRRVTPGREAAAAMQWDHAADLLGAEFEGLFSHLRVLHGKLKPQVVAAVRQIITEVGGVERFMETQLTPLANAYHYTLKAHDPAVRMDAGVRDHLIYLGRLSGSEWVPAALLVIKHHGVESLRARALLREIDRFAHLLRILCLGNGKRQRRFGAVYDLVHSGEPVGTDARAFELSRDETRTVLYNLRDLYRRNPQIAKLVLLRLNDELAGTHPTTDLTGLTVEHVLPQRPSASGEWRKLFPDADARKACTESIGNLVLVPPRQNDRARNQEFHRKKQIYLETDAEFPLLPITREVLVREHWRPEDVIVREARLLGMLADLWGFDGDVLTTPIWATASANSRNAPQAQQVAPR